jgi:pyridoxine 4-dehydrogenase
VPLSRPEYLRQQVELSLRRLGIDRIELFQLHRIDPAVPLEDQIGALAQLRDEGKINRIGLSEVGIEQIEAARRIVEISSVQNRYNLTDRTWEDVLEYCEAAGIAFVPWLPIARGERAGSQGVLGKVAADVGASPAQVSLAWLLHRSPVIVPIPGTGSREHLEENCAAASLNLSEDQVNALSAGY